MFTKQLAECTRHMMQHITFKQFQ